MKRIFLLLAVLLAACGSQTASTTPRRAAIVPTGEGGSPIADDDHEAIAAGSACGIERWAVKTGMDTDAGKVNLTPSPATIAHLVTVPSPIPPNSRAQIARQAPTEMTTFTVSASLTAYKLEADSDLHLVLDDGAGHTMIAEIPDPNCIGRSPFKTMIGSARAAFLAALPTPSATRFTVTKRPVTITGVGFFDFVHGQRGVAANAIELHPVVAISFG